MLPLFLSLFCLAVIIAVPTYLKRRGKPAPEIQRGRPDGCCGQHAVCEKEELMKALSEPVEYFDDEHLDDFRGRTADSYCPQEEDVFREVLYTMPESEVADWLRSLQLRHIELPNGLKDEAMMLRGE